MCLGRRQKRTATVDNSLDPEWMGYPNANAYVPSDYEFKECPLPDDPSVALSENGNYYPIAGLCDHSQAPGAKT